MTSRVFRTLAVGISDHFSRHYVPHLFQVRQYGSQVIRIREISAVAGIITAPEGDESGDWAQDVDDVATTIFDEFFQQNGFVPLTSACSTCRRAVVNPQLIPKHKHCNTLCGIFLLYPSLTELPSIEIK
jgi:hypothetical protein